MKAVVYERYGPPDVVEVREVARPRPGPGDVLVRVHATSVSSGDARLRASRFPPLFWLPGRVMLGLIRPKNRILGSDFAGEVVDVGAGVTRFRAGDQVFGFRLFGAHAEYVCLPEGGVLARKPSNLSHEEAAAIPFGGLSALHFLRKAGIERARRVLVVGASGGVGVFAVQLARHFGAEVTAVCSAANLDLARSLGAARAIDYTREDFTKTGEAYDIILDTVGATTFGRCRRSLSPNGVHVFLVMGLAQIVQAAWTPLAGGQRVVAGVTVETAEDLEFLRGLAETGQIVPVIDRCHPLEQAAEAHRRVDSGRKRGSVVLSLGPAAGR